MIATFLTTLCRETDRPLPASRFSRQFSRQGVASAEARLRGILPFILPKWREAGGRTFTRTFCPDGRPKAGGSRHQDSTRCRDFLGAWWRNPRSRHASRQTVGIPRKTCARDRIATSSKTLSLNESIVEDAAIEWFLLRQGYGGQVGELVPQAREVGHGAAFALLRRAKPYLGPGEPVAEPACAWATDRWTTIRHDRIVPISTGRETNP